MFDTGDLFELTQKRQMVDELQSVIDRENARLVTSGMNLYSFYTHCILILYSFYRLGGPL